MSDSYNDQATSNITLCFGDNEKVYAHKVILKAASEVWNQAFNSKLPISTQATYDIQAHSDLVVHTMLRHVYGMSLDAKPLGIGEEGRVDYFFDVFAIANEYQIPSLGEAVTQRVVEYMKTHRLQEGYIRTGAPVDPTTGLDTGNQKVALVISKTAELYANNNVADKSLMIGVADACFDSSTSLRWMEKNLHMISIVEKHDSFSGRLLRLYLASAR
jgi:hypothetical protein